MKTSCWIVTEGLIGTQNQCVALASALDFSYDIKVVKLKQPWKAITPWISHFIPGALATGSTPLTAPWPDMVIASGRKAIAAALWIKKQSGFKTKLVIIQSPVIKHPQFDLVIVPHHDAYHGKNTLAITGALSIITPDALHGAHAEWRDRLEPMPSPRIAVMIGGNSRTHKMTNAVSENLAAQLRELARTHSLMITASRRTPPDQQSILRQALHGKNIFFWDGSGDNPYRGFLAWADALIVTEDSVSMASEAIATGKPVYIIRMEGGSKRFRRFHEYLIEKGYARWFDGRVEHWEYTPPDDLAAAVEKIKELLVR